MKIRLGLNLLPDYYIENDEQKFLHPKAFIEFNKKDDQ